MSKDKTNDIGKTKGNKLKDGKKTDYEVGYGKPPKDTQWQKGQSGNKAGRGKGRRGLKTDLKDALKQRSSVRINGQEFKGSRQKIMLQTLTARAASGDVRATKLLTDLIMSVLGPEEEDKAKERLTPAEEAALAALQDDGRQDLLAGFERGSTAEEAETDPAPEVDEEVG